MVRILLFLLIPLLSAAVIMAEDAPKKKAAPKKNTKGAPKQTNGVAYDELGTLANVREKKQSPKKARAKEPSTPK